MQLSPIVATATATTPAPSFDRAFEYFGAGLYSQFSATSGAIGYGPTTGYESLHSAIAELRTETAGPARPAAAVFEHDGRFFARSLQADADFDDKLGGVHGPWDLEGHPEDLPMLHGEADGDILRDDALRVVVDGDVLVDMTPLPVGRRTLGSPHDD